MQQGERVLKHFCPNNKYWQYLHSRRIVSLLAIPGLPISKQKVLGKQHMRMEVSVGLVGEICQGAC